MDGWIDRWMDGWMDGWMGRSQHANDNDSGFFFVRQDNIGQTMDWR